MGRLDGKVAVVSGAARGQGRSHAVTLAREGAAVVAFDICGGFEFALAPPATEADLAETKRLVEEQGRRCLAVKADARDLSALSALADRVMSELGRVDVILVNHGIWVVAPNTWELEEGSWSESIDVLLTGAWKVCKAFVPKIIAGGRGGAVVLTGSASAVQAQPGAPAYTAAKHGLVGIMRVLAKELGRYDIRVNMVNPGAVATPMVMEGGTMELAMQYNPDFLELNRALLPVEAMEPRVISDAVLWLVSDEGRYVTGATIPVDAGWVAY